MANGFVLGTKKIWPNIIGHFRITFSLFLKASLGAHLSNENEISFTSKFNSFSYEWLCTRPRFEREALGNSEMVYSISGNQCGSIGFIYDAFICLS